MSMAGKKMGAVLVGMTLLLSCKHSTPPQSRPLSEDQFQNVYVALLQAGGQQAGPLSDSTCHSKSDSVFRTFGTSEREFSTTLASYKARPREWQRFFAAVIKKLEGRQREKTLKEKK